MLQNSSRVAFQSILFLHISVYVCLDERTGNGEKEEKKRVKSEKKDQNKLLRTWRLMDALCPIEALRRHGRQMKPIGTVVWVMLGDKEQRKRWIRTKEGHQTTIMLHTGGFPPFKFLTAYSIII